ncbi:aspartyl/glutamyl-tRNA(Asn/Gln) amidotransferase subunit C [Sphingomonas sp. IBVSS1]|jgi:aspartyl-tRNA(Asn)/glutamyl-tRNA(Gln) amidotransferase subunit C|uniref:Aspartyl/glutamyl-tRNA(Asn/Gln) amidotransferase subunit C n=1 Tax=Sandarakinorhabdus cyanobacteriorum TaxID=1981098 RepID=A0A255Z108_9SPHN|nr:Asp-tRNA(Asn)/Glu-tRNA(Gln) amidotransferase subunit GatC [Sandarakinorhabdus cyanobacteriorum]OSZ72448.1 aspartyl/glutamyl-tRNA(Asn/Gln) amidotransferase subunit C [Sphingomonas sp. IBVSS1]OYQ35101.1 Asp-tRNA(Asn)/Glu-tRNA(Gln) amidotransferase GatCAB subunit C [Sandarakinorhabdus cyanobacteriorum]
MSVDSETVRKIARLARIAVTEDEVPGLTEQLNGILGWIEQLGEVDTKGVEPMASVMPGHLRWRADAVTDGGIPDKVLANAPEATSGFFAVPKVIE